MKVSLPDVFPVPMLDDNATMLPENQKNGSVLPDRHSLKSGLLLFAGLAAALLALVPFLHRSGAMDWACLALTRQVAGLIRMTGLQAEIFNGNGIHLARVDWEMVLECTAISTGIIWFNTDKRTSVSLIRVHPRHPC